MKGIQNLILVGPMGSGKSVVGRQLALALRRPFIDCDTELEKRIGADIRFIFDKEGEAGFRIRERELISELLDRRGIILSTGGGAVLLEENRRRLREGGLVIYLQTSIEQQLARVRQGERRPLLAEAADLPTRLAELMAQRAPLYEEVAARTILTDGHQVREVVDRILTQLPAD